MPNCSRMRACIGVIVLWVIGFVMPTRVRMPTSWKYDKGVQTEPGQIVAFYRQVVAAATEACA